MASKRIVNASPLIHLVDLGLIDLLNEPEVDVIVPDAVIDELSRLNPNDPAVVAVRSQPWIQIATVSPIPQVVKDWNLGAGESAVLALGLAEATSHVEVVLEDQKARRCAASLGIPTRGTLSLILIARHTGKVVAVKPLLDQLRAGGMHLTDKLIAQVLTVAGE